jgi:tetratricopeptide (TPR) repeat protein
MDVARAHPSVAAAASRYRAYISYSHGDRGWADWLHRVLETYRVPSRLVGTRTAAGVVPRRLIPVFRDRTELASAADLAARINEAIQRSDNMIVICSPRAAVSRWVNEEVLAFKRLGREERIFCLIVDGEPNVGDLPGRAPEECFVPALRYHLGTDGALSDRRTEPIAADARPGKDGKANAKLKLIAGLLDVGFDTLKQREQRRHMRRMAATTAAALVVMAVTTVLAVDALIERHHALIAQQAAERRQKQAEELVRFMLGDLHDKLAQVGRLDVMQAVDDKAMAYFRSLPTADVTDRVLAQRVKALQEIGATRESEGELAKALEAYRSASTLAAELLQHAPTDVMRQADYANTLSWIGRVDWYQGNLAQAAQNFRAASELLRKAAAARPADNQLGLQLSSALVNTGRVLEAHGDFDAAKPYYEAARDTYARLSERDPSNPEWSLQLAYAYNDLGKLAFEQGHLENAIRDYRADQRLKSALAARQPKNQEVAEGLLVSDAILGRTLGWCNDMPDALHFTALAVASARKLMAFDPKNDEWADFFGLYSQQLGSLLRQRGQLGLAAAADDDAVRVLSALAAKDPANTSWQQDLAQSRLELSRLQLARNDLEGAASTASAAQATVERLLGGNPGDRGLVLLAAQAELVAGQIAAERRNSAAARQYWLRARDAVLPATRSGADPNFIAAWIEALLRLGETGAARPALVKLNAMGYRTPDFAAVVTHSRLAYPVNAAFARRIAQLMREDAAHAPPAQGAVRPSSAASR